MEAVKLDHTRNPFRKLGMSSVVKIRRLRRLYTSHHRGARGLLCHRSVKDLSEMSTLSASGGSANGRQSRRKSAVLVKQESALGVLARMMAVETEGRRSRQSQKTRRP